MSRDPRLQKSGSGTPLSIVIIAWLCALMGMGLAIAAVLVPRHPAMTTFS